MVGPLNHVAIAAPRTGNTTHTIDPSNAAANGGTVVAGAQFTPTSGRFLMCFADGAVTSTTPSSWGLPTNGSAVNNNGLYLWTKTSSGGETITTTHNVSNYPVIFHFLEFTAGSTLTGVASNAIVNSGSAGPTLSGLTGTNWIGFIASQTNNAAGTISYTWSAGTEMVDYSVGFVGTDGYGYSVAYLEDSILTSASSTCTSTNGGITLERMVVAVNIAPPPPVGPLRLESIPGYVLLENGTQVLL